MRKPDTVRPWLNRLKEGKGGIATANLAPAIQEVLGVNGEADADMANAVEAVGEICADSDGEAEAEVAVAIRNPETPRQAEIAEHELCHLPFRSWRTNCHRGKAKNDPHRKGQVNEGSEPNRPVISMDYMYMDLDYVINAGDEHRKKVKEPILVIVDSKSKATFAHVVDHKGASDAWVAKRVVADIEDLGHKEVMITMKSDQEPSMIELQREVTRLRGAGTVPENSPVGESASNGMVERHIQRVQGQARTLMDGLEAKIQKKLSKDHPIYPWIIEWSATTLTRYQKTSTGKTPHERIRGRPGHRPIAHFREHILYMPLKGAQSRRLKGEMKMEYGIWIGLKMRTDEVLVGTPRGNIRARTIKRLPDRDKWDHSF